MGHTDIKTTLRYAHYTPNPNEVAMVNAAFAVADDKTDDKLSKSARNSQTRKPCKSGCRELTATPTPGWGPGGRRFKSCLPD